MLLVQRGQERAAQEFRERSVQTEIAVFHAVLSSRSIEYASARSRAHQQLSGSSGAPVDMKRNAAAIAARFPGTVQRRDH